MLSGKGLKVQVWRMRIGLISAMRMCLFAGADGKDGEVAVMDAGLCDNGIGEGLNSVAWPAQDDGL